MSPLSSIQLYKTYSRTALLYGVENVILLSGELDRLKFFDTNPFQKTLDLYSTSHNTALFNAIKLSTKYENLMLIKLNFIVRLARNRLTSDFTNELLAGYTNVPNKSLIFALNSMVKTSQTIYNEMRKSIKLRIRNSHTRTVHT